MCKNLLTVDAHAHVRDSLHEPQVKCFSKGKEHKKFEFGSKGSLLTTQTTGVIV